MGALHRLGQSLLEEGRAFLAECLAEIEQDAGDGTPIGIELHLRGERDGRSGVVAIHEHRASDVGFLHFHQGHRVSHGRHDT